MSKFDFFQKKYLLTYLFWMVFFFGMFFFQTKEKTVGIILFALFLAVLFSILTTHLFYKMISNTLRRNDEVEVDLFSEEQLVYRTNANLKQHWIMKGGVLFLTSQRICFMYTEFKRDKLILELSKEEISEITLKDNNRIILNAQNNKNYLFVVENNKSFHDKYLLSINK